MGNPELPGRAPRNSSDPGSDAALAAAFDAFSARSSWRVLVRNQARLLLDAVQEIETTQTLSDSQKAEALLIRRSIARAVAAAAYSPGWRTGGWKQTITGWVSGSGIETAWAELHQSSERMLMIQSPAQIKARLPEIDAALISNVAPKDTRLGPAQKRIDVLAGASDTDIAAAREEIRGYLHTADQTGDEAHASVRSFRNLLIAVSATLAGALVVVCVLHALDPTFLDLSAPPRKGAPDAVEAWQAAIAGSLGGLIGAVWAISRLGGFSSAYRLPVYLALLRIPVGAATGLIAVVVIQSQLISGLQPQSGLTLLAYAIVFGYAPDVLLRFLDQKAEKVLGQAQSKDAPAHTTASSS